MHYHVKKDEEEMDQGTSIQQANRSGSMINRLSAKGYSEAFREEDEIEEQDTNTTQPQHNIMISKLKFRILKVLLHLLEGHEPDDDFYYEYRRKITPETFRLNLAYFYFFFHKYHKQQY